MKKQIAVAVVLLTIMVWCTACASVEAEFADGTKVKSQSCFMSLAELEGIWTSGASITVKGAKSETEQVLDAVKAGVLIGAGGVAP